MNKFVAVGALATGAVLAGLGFAGFGKARSEENAAVTDVFSQQEETAVRSIVEAYIRENPDVIISALNNYAQQEQKLLAERQAQARADALPFLISDKGAFSAGRAPEKADVAVVEFFDYHCGFCKRASGLVQDLTKDDEAVKVVFRELPILRRESEIAARYALAAREQEKYVDFHFKLMNASGVLSEKRVLDFAKKSGLDIDELKEAFADPKLEQEIEFNHMVAEEIGAEGTPNFLVASVDGKYIELITGFRPDELQRAIDAAKRGETTTNRDAD